MIASKTRAPVHRLVSHVTRISDHRAMTSMAISSKTTTTRAIEILSTNSLSAASARYGSEPLRRQSFSTLPTDDLDDEYYTGPVGDLFGSHKVSEEWVGRTASIRRVFGAGSNAQGLLACGGEDLAIHASFDPDYNRARSYIQNRPIGPAVISPVLISGLVGALVEAALPQSIPLSAGMHQVKPLIVGVEVCAKIKVVSVIQYNRTNVEMSLKEKDFGSRQDGFDIALETEVCRVLDDAVIAEGTHSVWIPSSISY